MRLTAAFFANRAGVVNDMLNLEGGFWASTTVPAGSAAFTCATIVLCDADASDVGQPFSMRIDAEGPTGRRWTPAHSSDFTVDRPMTFMCMPSMVLPIEPGGGRHVYTFRLDGQHERVDVPLDVHLTGA